ncbi:GNAT family N-acetyltransferase [Candidatus Cloacimonadota bacterium]
MKTINKPYSGYKKEYFQMRDLLIESYRLHPKPLNWLIGRLDNWRYASFTDKIKETPNYYTKNAHLWYTAEGKLAGFFISENGKKGFEIQIHPEHRELEEEILSWVLNNWLKDRGGLYSWAYGWDDRRIGLLESKGFINEGLEAVDFRYDLKIFNEDIKLNAEYQYEKFSDRFNYEEHIETQRLAFNRTKDQLNREWFETKCIAPGYSEDWDFLIANSKGHHITFCVAWIDELNKFAEIDPVGTHPDHRREGLAKAVINHCFVELNKSGYGSAQILGFSDAAKTLYKSLKPVEEYEIYRFKYKG